MKKLVTIGEALIDFIPDAKGKHLKDVQSFKKVAGGAPANVAGAVSKLSGNAIFLTKLGNDAFGDYIIDCLNESGIDTTYIKRSEKYDTSLAFVSLAEDGNREFQFYRRTAADLMFEEKDIPEHILHEAGIIHFCSVDLIEGPMKQAHYKLIEMAEKEGVLISFDPNLRFPLWEDKDALKQTVQEFMQYADIIKISDEELEFITGKKHIEEALEILFAGKCRMVVYTIGKDGARLYRREDVISVHGCNVKVRDTTGAGDSFIGAFLYKIMEENAYDLEQIDAEKLTSYLTFANAYAAYTTTKEGALASMANKEEFECFLATI